MQTTVQQRIILFLFGCLLIRSIPIYIIIKSKDRQNWIIIFYLIVGLSLLYQYFYNKSKYGFFGGLVWWHNLRLFHGLLYLLFILLYLNQVDKAYYLLIFDLIIGLYFFINNYS